MVAKADRRDPEPFGSCPRDDARPERPVVSALLGLGSNLGDRLANLQRGLELLAAQDGVEIVRQSGFIETEPVGGPPQGRYLNGAVEILTTLAPRPLLDVLKRIELEAGRVRTVRNAPRTLDLDLLLYGDQMSTGPDLEIPHPRMLERAFVLEVLVRIAPTRTHPVSGRSLLEHWRELRRRVAPDGCDRGERRSESPGGTP
jgi:2-amino-4-hydroxy-6-hydroxymethyldihydropteridine diphosphokinase